MRFSWLGSVFFVVACGQSSSDDRSSSVQQCELDTSELCGNMSTATVTAGPTEASAFQVLGDSTYTIHPPAPGKRGYVLFVAQFTGTHTLYFGDEEPARVCEEDAICKSEVTSCGPLEQAAQYAFNEGEPYVIELKPLANDQPFVLHIVEPNPDPPLTGDLKLADPVTYPTTGTITWDVSVGDLDGDGDLDAAVSNPDDAGGELYVDVMRNDDGAFAHAARIQTSAPRQTAIADFDGDGDNDIVGIAADGQGPLPNFLLRNDGDFVFTRLTWTTDIQYTGSLSIGDFDEDGIPDVVATYVPGGGEVTSGFVIHKMPSGVAIRQMQGFGAHTSQAIAGDFNGDGHQDVLVGSRFESKVRLYLGDGDGNFEVDRELTLPVTPFVSKLQAYDLDGNAYTDFIAWGTDSEGLGKESASVTLNSASGFAIGPRTLMSYGIAAGDYDHDGRTDLISSVPDDFADPHMLWFRGTGTGFEFVETISRQGFTGSSFMIGADVDADGFDDLVQTGLRVFLGTP